MKRLFIFFMTIAIFMAGLLYPAPVYAATQTSTITGDGHAVGVTYVGGAADWTNLNSDDDDVSYAAYAGGAPWIRYGYWTFDNFTQPYASITSVTIYAKVKEMQAGNLGAFGWYDLGSSTRYMSAWYNTALVYRLDHETYLVNPATGIAWTDSDINNMEVVYGVNCAAIGSRVSYMYIVIDYEPPVSPSVTTSAATNIEYSGGTHNATLNGLVTDDGGGTLDFRGFVWDTVSRANPGNVTPPATYANNWTEGSAATGVFNHEISGLVQDTTYYFRGFAHNEVGWTYGDEASFETLGNATIQTNAATYVTATTANLNSLVIDDGQQACDVRFGYDNATHAGSPFTDYGVNGTLTAWVNDTYTIGQQPNVGITGLLPSTTYYFNVQIANDIGDWTGTELSFTTSSGISEPTDFEAKPTDVSVHLSWIRGDGSSMTLIRYKEGAYPTHTADGTLVYFDEFSSYEHTGLTRGTTYYYAAWGWSGGTYSTNSTLAMTTTLASAPAPDVLTPPTTPDIWNQAPAATRMAEMPFYDFFNEVYDTYSIPRNTGWFLFAIGVVTILGIIVYNQSHSVPLMIGVISVGIFFEGIMGIMSAWIAFPVSVMGLAASIVGWRL